jgi:tRNA pseudouridine13 synthase
MSGTSEALPAPLPRGHGDALVDARIRSVPDDFQVDELPAFEPSGSGEHLLLQVEKRGMTTAYAAGRIADWAGVVPLAIGYAGLKDRHAVTRQRFSVHFPKRSSPDVATLESDDLRVLDATWHSRKLPRGALAGNRFRLLLRDVVPRQGVDRSTIDERLRQIAAHGVPNYFGEQRFGRGGDNVEQARRMFAGARMRREQRGILLSAVRSDLFNRVLAARVAAGCWSSGIDGEVWMLEGSHSVFGPEPLTEELAGRAARQDIHPTGPLWGRGELRSAGRCREIEQAALAGSNDLRDGLEGAGLKQERRALRVAIAALGWEWQADDRLLLEFELPPGAYATTVMRELGDLADAQREG